jgi:hypothetical protein
MDEIRRRWREEIRQNAGNVTDAVKIAGRHVGLANLLDYQAAYLAEVARSFAESRQRISYAVPREQWADPQVRAHTRQRMRHQLLDTVTRQGYIPVGLPAETLKYLDPWSWNPGIDLDQAVDRIPEIPAEAVEQGADWATVVLILTVPVRRPPIDRAKAVQAGILTGDQEG